MKKHLLFFAGLIVVLNFLMVNLVQAQFAQPTTLALNGTVSNTPSQTNTPTTNQTNSAASSGKTLLQFDPKVSEGSLAGLLNRIVNILIGLIASVSIIFIVVGGFRLAFSQGNSEAVSAGKKTITWAIVGLIVALLAFAIVRIVIKLIY